MEFRPLNARGADDRSRCCTPCSAGHPHWDEFGFAGGVLAGRLKPLPALFPEEERSKQPSAFSILRALIEEFRGEEDSRLGLVGAFGYDLLFQFEPIEKKLPRARPQGPAPVPLRRHLVHGPQEGADRALPVRFRARRRLHRGPGPRRRGDRRRPPARPPAPSSPTTRRKSTWRTWRRCAKACAAATTTKWCCARPSARRTRGKASDLFERVQRASPSPYEFLLQFGDEQLVGASPEMFVRVEGQRVETCPISGTAQRTGDPLRDADNIRELLNPPRKNRS